MSVPSRVPALRLPERMDAGARRPEIDWLRVGAIGLVFLVRVRVGRLLVPLVAGTLLLVPPQVYLRRVDRGEFGEGLLEFYPRFFHRVFPDGNFSYGHLWLIA